MKLYAIRDRLIDYYLRPFTTEGDKETIASVAEAINHESNKTPLAQTPHHFEIWRLAEIDQETGLVVPSRELIADCGSLVRDVRPTVDQRREAIDRAARGSQGETGGMGSDARTNGSALQGETPPNRGSTRLADQTDPRGTNGPSHRGRLTD